MATTTKGKPKKPANPLAIECPHCHAPKGQRCVRPGGQTYGGVHSARRGGNPPGRPGILATIGIDDAIVQGILKALSKGTPLEVAAQAAGISRTTLYRWLERGDTDSDDPESKPYRDFRDAAARARAQAGVAYVDAINQVAMGGYTYRTTDVRTGEVTEHVARPDWRAGAFMLERTLAQHFGRRQTMEIGLADGSALRPGERLGNEGGPTDDTSEVEAQLARLRDRHGRMTARQIAPGEDAEGEVVDGEVVE